MTTHFDIAISFAGPERDYARAIAEIARENGINVLFDEIYEAELWGNNLKEDHSDIYENKADYCLIIVSEEYRKGIYTNIERRAALERAIRNKKDYILPVVVDGSWIVGLPKSTAYLDLRHKSVINICEILIRKLKGKQAGKLLLPEDLNIPRLPIGSLSSMELKRYFIELCSLSEKIGVVVFGCIVYNESTAELRELLTDEDYWEALDKASGPNFEIFAIKDEKKYNEEISTTMQFLTQFSSDRTSSKGYYFSKLLKEYFGESKRSLVYPSFILFLVRDNIITQCRLIPLERDTRENVFLALQKLFTTIARSIDKWKKENNYSTTDLWDTIKIDLLMKEYTIYIQTPPQKATDAVELLAPFME